MILTMELDTRPTYKYTISRYYPVYINKIRSSLNSVREVSLLRSLLQALSKALKYKVSPNAFSPNLFEGPELFSLFSQKILV